MTTSDLHRLVKQQFNQQAQNFSNWSVTQNKEYHQAYFDFCQFKPEDTLLDLACGTGEWAMFCAPKIKFVQGIDISEGMIEIAAKQAEAQNLKNMNFVCQPVERTPFPDNSFSIVTCKSAFHHFSQYEAIFEEMIRCCESDGRISIQDIAAYSDATVNSYFEELERQIDVSHHNTLAKEFLIDLYTKKNIQISQTYEIEVELNFREYLTHAKQSELSLKKIEMLLEKGLNDASISKFYLIKENEIYFKRTAFIILGKK